MREHYLQIVSDEGEAPSLRFVCTAPPDAPCRRRPDDDRESWDSDDPDLTSGHECWVSEWVEADWDSLQVDVPGVLASIPVEAKYVYDEGPSLEVINEPTNAEVEAAAEALCELDGMYKYRSLGATSSIKTYYRSIVEVVLKAAREVWE